MAASASASASTSAPAQGPSIERYCSWMLGAFDARMKAAGLKVGSDKGAAEGVAADCAREAAKDREADPVTWNACASCRMEHDDLEGDRCRAACTPKAREVIRNPSKADAAADYRARVCDALSASGVGDADPKQRLEKALAWSYEHVTTAPALRVVGAVKKSGVDRSWIGNILREGGREASYEGPCALADAFEAAYPCPADSPSRCGKDTK
jgi:hypothetical protein